jgi:eukaryotic-like serine/threonine-protein kinase
MSTSSELSWERLNDRYQIQQSLGKKAGRQTFLALDEQTQMPVVVKLLTFAPDFEWADLKLFEREAETLKSLDHPAIPRYLDYFEVASPSRKGFALVQSYIAAKSLAQQLQAGRTFSEAEVKQLAESLLEILDYLHSQQPPVIHRDIKPSNLLLGDRSGNHVGQVYLVDFGSVQTLVAQEGGTITVVGTYGYMPPEQYGGRAMPASDLYSLGATLIGVAES